MDSTESTSWLDVCELDTRRREDEVRSCNASSVSAIAESSEASLASNCTDCLGQSLGTPFPLTLDSSPSSESYFTGTDESTTGLSSNPGIGQVNVVLGSNALLQLEDSDSELSSDPKFRGLPSEGSLGHATFTCKPCMFIHSGIGCYKGWSCGFCHFSHDQPEFRRPRPCKAKRERYRKLIEVTAQRMHEEELENSPEISPATSACGVDGRGQRVPS
mmetsp:Transcript_103630/g.182672  ORF Transcript_103630/g.182672 Transcript_103630/m.182672 type:complete len:217 (+) Transcript_103630:96-746(+)